MTYGRVESPSLLKEEEQCKNGRNFIFLILGILEKGLDPVGVTAEMAAV